jgi:hypothetical protein
MLVERVKMRRAWKLAFADLRFSAAEAYASVAHWSAATAACDGALAIVKDRDDAALELGRIGAGSGWRGLEMPPRSGSWSRVG